MREPSAHKPYSALGNRLKRMRQKLQETLAEVSGAVEIDVETLSRIEGGERRPTEAVLLLLINHFGIKEDEADGLWQLAGFEQPRLQLPNQDDETTAGKTVIMMTAADPRIVYTDIVHVMANNYGVVLNFMQTNGPGTQPLAVARIGMSKEHARSVIDILQKALTPSSPKALPAPGTQADNRSKN